MTDPTYTLRGIDRETGEVVEVPMSPRQVEQLMIDAEGLPDPADVIYDDEAPDDAA